MKITHVRVRQLKSTPGFNHRAVEVEAAIGEDEHPSTVRRDLELWCEAELSGKTLADLQAELGEVKWTIDRLRRSKTALEVEAESLRSEIARLGGVLAAIKLKEEDTGQSDIETAIADTAAALGADVGESVADQIIGEIERRFPNWRSYRNLLDCIDWTLHELRSQQPGRFMKADQ